MRLRSFGGTPRLQELFERPTVGLPRRPARLQRGKSAAGIASAQALGQSRAAQVSRDETGGERIARARCVQGFNLEAGG